MKTILMIISVLLIINSCTQDKSKVRLREMKEYYESLLKKSEDSTATITDFKFLRYDTLTAMGKCYMYYMMLDDELERSYGHTDLQIQKLHDLKSDYQTARYLDLSSTPIKKDRWEEQKKVAIMYFQNDTILESEIRNIKELAERSDNKKAVNYFAYCLCTIKRKDNSVKSDTCLLYLDTLMNIISYEDFDKSVESVYKRKSKHFYDL